MARISKAPAVGEAGGDSTKRNDASSPFRVSRKGWAGGAAQPAGTSSCTAPEVVSDERVGRA